MTSEEYFAIALLTQKDFDEWIKSFLARADKAIKNADKYLSETTNKNQ